MRLTDAGRAVHERGPAALAALEEVWEAARRAGRGEAGRLRIAYSPSAGYDTAPRLVEALRERHPGVEVAAEVLPTPEIVLAVLDGRADVGVARTPVPADGVRLRTVRVERQGVLVPADHPLASRPEVELAAWRSTRSSYTRAPPTPPTTTCCSICSAARDSSCDWSSARSPSIRLSG